MEHLHINKSIQKTFIKSTRKKVTMIKIRAEAKELELYEFIKEIKTWPEVTVLSTSEPVPNRGDSVYYRSYIEIETQAKTEKNKNM